MKSEKICCVCKWWAGVEGVCANDNSEKCADFTSYDNSCECWEGNYKENDEVDE